MRSLVAVVVCLLSFSSQAGEPVAKQWAATFEETTALLQEQRFDDARTRLEQLKRSMLDQIGRGESADRLFAIAVGQLAVAQAGSGHVEEANWNWYIAQNILPDVRKIDLSRYGAAGELLSKNILPPQPEKCARPITEPPLHPTKRVEPDYPESVRRLRESGIIIVQIRLDSEGKPLEPQVIKTISPPMTYAALDALRQWRFEPFAPDDPLKDSPFCITFYFKLK